MTRGAIVASAAVMLAGCMPAHVPPPAAAAVSPPTAWRDAPTGTATLDPRWWQAFGDPVLTRLVETALARNTDVLTAVARVQEAQANIRTARAAMLPAIDAAGGIQNSRDLGIAGPITTTAIQPEL